MGATPPAAASFRHPRCPLPQHCAAVRSRREPAGSSPSPQRRCVLFRAANLTRRMRRRSGHACAALGLGLGLTRTLLMIPVLHRRERMRDPQPFAVRMQRIALCRTTASGGSRAGCATSDGLEAHATSLGSLSHACFAPCTRIVWRNAGQPCAQMASAVCCQSNEPIAAPQYRLLPPTACRVKPDLTLALPIGGCRGA